MTDPATVTALAITPVKAMRLREVEQIQLGADGAHGDRSFYVVDEQGRMVNAKQYGRLLTVIPEHDPATDELTLRFPDGTTAAGVVQYGEPVTARFYRRTEQAPQLVGPWSEALSEFLGSPLRLVASPSAVDRGRRGAASLVSRGSLQRLAEVADADDVDARRFRMLIEIDGVAPHAEDRWVGREVRVGPALLRLHGHVGRCMVTSRDPDSGETNLPTLDLLRSYRGEMQSTEPLPLGVYGEVVEGGVVRIGDPVEVPS